MKHANIITKLTLEQKCALLSGETVFTTRGYKNAGIPSITLSDGPNGVRKQAGAADHLPWPAAGIPPWANSSAGPWGRRPPRRRYPSCWGRASTPSAARCAGATSSISRRTRTSPASWPRPMCAASSPTASPPAPSTSPSTARSCAAWRRTPSSTSEPCGSST